MRTIWFGMETSPALDVADKIINRVCFCVFLFVFNALLFYWVDTVHTTVNVAFAKEAFKGTLDYDFMTVRGRILFWVATALVILLTVCSTLFTHTHSSAAGRHHAVFLQQLVLAIVRTALVGNPHSSVAVKRLYDANNIIIAVMFLIYAGFFLFYGTKLNFRISKNNSSSHKKDLIKAEVFSVLLFACFVVRFVMFSFRIFTGHEMNDVVYVVFSYMVPEVIPAVLCLWSVNTDMFDEVDSKSMLSSAGYGQASGYVDPLLAEETA